MFGVVMTLMMLGGLIVMASKLKQTRDELKMMRDEMRREMSGLGDRLRETRQDMKSRLASKTDAEADAEGLDPAKLFAPLTPPGGGVDQVAAPVDV